MLVLPTSPGAPGSRPHEPSGFWTPNSQASPLSDEVRAAGETSSVGGTVGAAPTRNNAAVHAGHLRPVGFMLRLAFLRLSIRRGGGQPRDAVYLGAARGAGPRTVPGRRGFTGGPSAAQAKVPD